MHQCLTLKCTFNPGKESAPLIPVRKPDVALHVATKKEDIALPTAEDNKKAEQPLCTTNTPTQNKDLHVKRRVTCPEDGIILSQFPWKQQLAVKMN